MNSWHPYVERYRRGEWRAPIFLDMVLDDIRARGGRPAVLDIGCGSGFDGDGKLQERLAAAAGTYVGVEPDPAAPLGPHFDAAYRCPFEEAPIRPGSVDVAVAVMVLEHLRRPAAFWAKLLEVLAPGGAFWGFTVDARHWFCRVSSWLERVRLKDLYLDGVLGKRGGATRYDNFPVYYRANTPAQVRRHAAGFARCEFLNLDKPGQVLPYLPRWLWPAARALEGRPATGRRGVHLVIRAVKGPLAATPHAR
jgi:SAM-dependent methyltransferase